MNVGSLAVAYPCTKLARNLKVEHADQSFDAKAQFFSVAALLL